MTWFAASTVIGMRRQDGKGVISIYENIILIEAETANDAHRIASEIGLSEANIEDGLTIDDMPAVRIFAGIRKIITVSNPAPYDLDQDRPITGTEITYSEFEVPDEDSLQRFARGETMNVLYLG